MNEQSAVAGIGHNSRSVMDVWKTENETLAARLVEDNKDLSARKAKLLAEADELPKAIRNDEQSGLYSDLVKRLNGLVKDAEAVRVATKRPVLDAEEIVDALFRKFKLGVTNKITDLNKIGTVYDLAKEAKARDKLEAEAQAARDEEDRLRAIAAKAAKKDNVEKTIVAAAAVADARNERVEAERAADVPAAALTRTSGEASTSSLVTNWHGEIEDFEKIDLNAFRKYISRSELEKAAERAGKDLKEDGIGKHKFLRIFSTKERRVA